METKRKCLNEKPRKKIKENLGKQQKIKWKEVQTENVDGIARQDRRFVLRFVVCGKSALNSLSKAFALRETVCEHLEHSI